MTVRKIQRRPKRKISNPTGNLYTYRGKKVGIATSSSSYSFLFTGILEKAPKEWRVQNDGNYITFDMKAVLSIKDELGIPLIFLKKC